MNSQTSLQILIKTVADTTGLQLTTDQAQRLDARLKDVAKSSGSASDAAIKVGASVSDGAKKMGEFQRAGNDASTMLGGLERATRGGIDGILGIATAFRGFVGLVRGAVASTGPLGILITALGLAAGAMLALSGRSKEAGKSIEDLKKEAQDLAKQKLDTLNQALVQAGKNADDAAAKFARLQAAAEKLDDAEKAARLAEVRADPNLNEEQKTRAESQIRREFSDRSDNRRRESLDEGVRRAERGVEVADQAALKPQTEYLNRVRERQDLEKQEADRARAEELRAESGRAQQAGDLPRARELDKEISSIAKRTEGFSPEKLEVARAREAKDKEAADAARRAQYAALDELRFARGEKEIGTTNLNTEATFRNRQFTAEDTVALRSARQRDASARPPAAQPRTSDGANQLYMRSQERDGVRSKALDEIKQLEDEAFKMPSFSPEASKLKKQAEEKRSALAVDDKKFDEETNVLTEKFTAEAKGAQSAISAAGDEIGAAFKALASKIVSGAQEAASQISSAPVAGSGGKITKGDGSVVDLPAGERGTESGPGTISRGGETFSVAKGDQQSVARAVREATQAQAASDQETIVALGEMKKGAEQTRRQMINARESSQP